MVKLYNHITMDPAHLMVEQVQILARKRKELQSSLIIIRALVFCLLELKCMKLLTQRSVNRIVMIGA